ncbi:MAG: PRC-barrel domain-containing protein [Gemmatimonadetes bacterium]|nr:PRC-barrel domain-containing protein [Gemmatimonadota bacterium]
MLVSATSLHGFHLKASDGAIGTVQEFYFDDQFWTIRYLVAATGGWLSQRKVLISPYALEGVNADRQEIATTLSRAQIEESPPLDSDKPVSRQFEESFYGYYDWPAYWNGPHMWGTDASLVRDRTQWHMPPAEHAPWDPHLRSSDEVRGYYLEASDGEIGHVDDFLIDDETWAIRYLVASTHNWWPGKRVLLAPQWSERVSWEEGKVHITATRAQVKAAPQFHEGTMPSRDDERALHAHFARPAYWAHAPASDSRGR